MGWGLRGTAEPGREPSARAAEARLARPLLAALVLTVGFLALALTVYVPTYETSDDSVMNLIAAGRILADRPDEHLLYSNVLIGLALKLLYEIAPHLPWYGLYLLSVMALSLLGLCYAALRAQPSAWQLLIGLLFLAAVVHPWVVFWQFTRVAALAALAGVLLLLTAPPGRTGLLQTGAGVLLGFLSSLVRFEACVLTCAVLAPAVVLPGVGPLTPRPRLSRCLLLAGVLALGLVSVWLNRWYYAQSPGWRDFYPFNALRARFCDYWHVNYNDRTRTVMEAVGWSKNDWMMLVDFNYADPERFSAAKLRAVLDAVGTADRIPRSSVHWEWIVRDRNPYYTLGMAGLALVLMGGGWRARVIPALCLLVAAGLCLVLFWQYRLPPRVIDPAVGAAAAVALVLHPRGKPGPAAGSWTPAGLLRGALVALFVFALLQRAWILFNDNLKVPPCQQKTQAMVTALAPVETKLFVSWGSFPYEDLVYPLKELGGPPSLKVVEFSYANPRVPFVARRLEEFGISDLYRALYEREDLFLFSSPQVNGVLSRYIKEHYGVTLTYRVVLPRVRCLLDTPEQCYQLRVGEPTPDRPGAGKTEPGRESPK